MLITESLPKSSGSQIRVDVRCDLCSLVYETQYRYVIRYRKKRGSGADYCWKCAHRLSVQTEQYGQNMSRVLRERYEKCPEIKEKISQTILKNKVNCGDKNGMKKIENREKVSKTRKEMFKSGKLSRESISKNSIKAWSEGKFEGVGVGRCKWYDYVKKDGTTIKCQGTWELAFAEWLDDNNLSFSAHKGRIQYEDNGVKRNYYPDFFIDEWNCYVDIKNDYHYKLQIEKFEKIAASNSGLKIKILLKSALKEMGVKFKKQ